MVDEWVAWLEEHAPAEQLQAWRRWAVANGRPLTREQCEAEGYSYDTYRGKIREIGRPRVGDDLILVASREIAPAHLASMFDP